MRLEVVDILVAVVPVDAHAVDSAVGARGHKVGEPGQSHGAAAVSDGWGAELGFTGEGFHVLLPSGCGIFRRHVGLGGEVGLIEGEEVLGTRVDGGLRVVAPRAGEIRSSAPEERQVADTAHVKAAAVTAPVVRPSNIGRAAEAASKAGVVVGKSTLAALGGRRAARAGRRGAGSADDRARGGNVGRA